MLWVLAPCSSLRLPGGGAGAEVTSTGTGPPLAPHAVPVVTLGIAPYTRTDVTVTVFPPAISGSLIIVPSFSVVITSCQYYTPIIMFSLSPFDQLSAACH